MLVRAITLVELEVLAKHEEHSWGQKSRTLWLKQGDKSARFLRRVATTHWRYDTIDKLMVRREVQESKETKEAMIELYSYLYSEFDYGDPPLNWKDVLQSLWKRMSGFKDHS